jgi:hypothetical protein
VRGVPGPDVEISYITDAYRVKSFLPGGMRETISCPHRVDDVCAAHPAGIVFVDREIHRFVPRVCTLGLGVVHSLSP